MDQHVRAARRATLERVAKALKDNRMEARVVETPEELVEALRGLLPQGASVATGGSMTLAETGVKALLEGGGYDYYYRGRTGADGQPLDVYRAAFSCDWYLSSANAITPFRHGRICYHYSPFRRKKQERRLVRSYFTAFRRGFC